MSSKSELSDKTWDLPCVRMVWHEAKQKDVPAKAAVECARHCESCGFSGLEQARRLREGHWVEHGGVRTLHFVRA